MLRVLLENFTLIGACVASFVAGVFLSSQWLKDKIRGIPPELRKALVEGEQLAVRAVKHFAATKATAAYAMPSVSRPVVPPAPAPDSTAAAPAAPPTVTV